MFKKKNGITLIGLVVTIIVLLILAAIGIEEASLQTESGEPVVLRGISTHGLQWRYGAYITSDSVKYLKDEFNVNVIRAAMYTWQNGYIDETNLVKKNNIKTKVKDIVQYAYDNDMYVIIDWHILYDNDPTYSTAEAMEFFDEMASLYNTYPNVIYEICNEPNDKDRRYDADNPVAHPVSWDTIVSYADLVIPQITKHYTDGHTPIIIVGTPEYSSNFDDVASSKLTYQNAMYTFHFYPQSNIEKNAKKMQKVDEALAANIPVFISEWGSGSTTTDIAIYEETAKWLAFMEDRGLSWCYWNFSNSAPTETGENAKTFLKPDYVLGANINEYLTKSALLIRTFLIDYEDTTTGMAGQRVKTPDEWGKTVQAILDGEGNTIPIPAGFYYVGGTKNTGVVISDKEEDYKKGENGNLVGNQFVFIPMGNGVDYERTNFDSDSKFLSMTDETYQEYQDLVYKYGGFYIGRYESGIPEGSSWTLETTDKHVSGIPQIKKGIVPWNYIKANLARSSCRKLYATVRSNTSSYENWDYAYNNYIFVMSDLCDSKAWDTVLSWIQSTSSNNYIGDSHSYGNYSGTIGLTGHSEQYKINNIYDLSGNMSEYTTEKLGKRYILRGGNFLDDNATKVSKRTEAISTGNGDLDESKGFRVVLYIK